MIPNVQFDLGWLHTMVADLAVETHRVAGVFDGYEDNDDEEEDVELASISPERLAKLPRTKLQPSPESDLRCAICLDEFDVSIEVVQLTCKHPFHPECMEMWLQRSLTCPMCKEIVDI